MTSLFPPWSNATARAGLALASAGLVGAPLSAMVWVRSPYATGARDPRTQPVHFDHRHHASDDGIDCLYCHDGATRSRYAGVPATSVCVGCHAQVWSESPLLAPVWRSARSGQPLRWARVHSLPDHVFFDHAAHTRRGVGCVTCHGRVDQMPAVYAVASLSMDWCLDCHRAPDAHLRPLDRVTDMTWTRTPDAPAPLRVDPPLHCSGCHR